MLRAKAFTELMPEASDWKMPFRLPPPPNSLAIGLSSLMGLMHFSLPEKKVDTSINKLLPCRACILKPLSTGFMLLRWKAGAMGSLGLTSRWS